MTYLPGPLTSQMLEFLYFYFNVQFMYAKNTFDKLSKIRNIHDYER